MSVGDEKKTKMSGERERGRIKEKKGATEEESRASSQYRLSLGLLTVFAPRKAEVKRGCCLILGVSFRHILMPEVSINTSGIYHLTVPLTYFVHPLAVEKKSLNSKNEPTLNFQQAC